MKKIITFAIALIFALTVNANESKMANTEAFNLTVNTEKLADALNASKDQSDAIDDIMKLFEVQMESIKTEESYASRENMLNSALDMNIKYMRAVLNDKQYKTYLILLNTTLYNRGLK